MIPNLFGDVLVSTGEELAVVASRGCYQPEKR